MQKQFQFQVLPEVAAKPESLYRSVSQFSGIPLNEIRHVEILRRSIDARQRQVKINLKVDVYVNEDFKDTNVELPIYEDVSKADPVHIVGAGPAGLFAALKCIELGKKPIILERGKDVRSRRRDLREITLNHSVNPESNYCFGEGGAGTFSDGKLYTRSKKRGVVQSILEKLVGFGATKEILVNAQPHIGTNKLPQIIQEIREKIIEVGGEVHFDTKLLDIEIRNDTISKLITSNGSLDSQKVILATGHSAHDIFDLLDSKGIEIEAKPFALGVRVEHPQELIDQIQYKCETRGEFLPPSPYSIVKQVNERGVYSFCMCPGGVIAPSATNPGEVVTNGWSPSKRDQPWANSGIVVELKLGDFKEFGDGPLAALKFQSSIEKNAWKLAGETQKVPAQRLVDFTNKKVSNLIPETSYKPGTTSLDMQEVLPDFIYNTLRTGFKEFNKSIRGYLTNEAVVHAPESRTSSPIRIPRDRESLQHIRVKGMYPCGEGAGYAGGIVSAAIDGEKCAEKACI